MVSDTCWENVVDFALNPKALRRYAETLQSTSSDVLLLKLIADREFLHESFMVTGKLGRTTQWIGGMSSGSMTITFDRIPRLRRCVHLWIFRTIERHGVGFFEATRDSPAWNNVIYDEFLRLWRQQVLAGLTPDFESVEVEDDYAKEVCDTRTMLFLMADYLEDLKE